MKRMISMPLVLLLWVLGNVQGSLLADEPSDGFTKPLQFRAMFLFRKPASAKDCPTNDPEGCPSLAQEARRLTGWSNEGFNAVVWLIDAELNGTSGAQALARFQKFPEARELAPELNEKYIAQMQWLLGRAKALGMKNYFYVNLLQYTKAFAKAHDLNKPRPISPTVHHFQHGNYGGNPNATNMGVRNELTRSYIEELFVELLDIYKDLDGFYGPMGETVPGNRSTFYKEAIVPALQRSGRRPLFIAHQWQIPLEDYLKNIAPQEVYDNTWLGFHAYNSEQITDAAPYPGLVLWAQRTGLPTVAALYPANCIYFPFNSPKLAAQIADQMKRTPNFKGFMYWEHSGPIMSPLFRKALGHYASRREVYSDEPWLALLEEQYGDRIAAEHFLRAYNLSGIIMPEMCALIYVGSDYLRRDLQISYELIRRTWRTSPVRGNRLIPVREYARAVAKNPERFRNSNGSDWTRPPYKQEVIWGGEGGSLYEVIPPVHMRKIRQLGETALQEAQLALATVKRDVEAAQQAVIYMKSYMLFTRYYERKVAAATEALVFAHGHRESDKLEALKLADEALACYEEAARFYIDHIEGTPALGARSADLPARLEKERQERKDLADIFQWPGATSGGAQSAKTKRQSMNPLLEEAGDLKFRHGNLTWLQLDGRDAYVIQPKATVDPQRRWVWVAPWELATRQWKSNPLPTQVEYEYYIEELTARGFHIVGVQVGTSLGAPAGVALFDKFYDLLMREYKLNPKARMIGQSNGGLIAYAWAFRRPQRVDRILGSTRLWTCAAGRDWTGWWAHRGSAIPCTGLAI